MGRRRAAGRASGGGSDSFCWDRTRLSDSTSVRGEPGEGVIMCAGAKLGGAWGLSYSTWAGRRLGLSDSTCVGRGVGGAELQHMGGAWGRLSYSKCVGRGVGAE